MTYEYTLTNTDLRKLGIETDIKEAIVTQNGWTGEYSSLVEVIENEYGFFNGKTLLDTITSKMEKYITKNCKCKEY